MILAPPPDRRGATATLPTRSAGEGLEEAPRKRGEVKKAKLRR
jgi:hypothetical protein